GPLPSQAGAPLNPHNRPQAFCRLEKCLVNSPTTAWKRRSVLPRATRCKTAVLRETRISGIRAKEQTKEKGFRNSYPSVRLVSLPLSFRPILRRNWHQVPPC